jgi:proteic killer suppression protein
MIRNFTDKATERLFRDGVCPARWRSIEAVALRKLDMVDAAWMTCFRRRVIGWKR